MTGGQRKAKRAALPESLGLDPDFAAVCLDDALDQRQTDARSFALRIQFVEQAENLVLILCFDAHAVVMHVEHRPRFSLPYPDLDPGLRLLTGELAGVVQQVLYDIIPGFCPV